MAAVNTCSDFGVQENKTCYCFPFSLLWSDGNGSHDLRFLNVEFQASFFHSPLSPSSRGPVLHFVPLEWYHLHIWGCWYFSTQSWFQLLIHPAQHFTRYTLHINWRSRMKTCSLVVLLSQFWTSHSCPVLTVTFWPSYRFLRGHLRWYGTPNLFKNFSQFVVIHIVKGFNMVNQAEVDVFLEFPYFLHD